MAKKKPKYGILKDPDRPVSEFESQSDLFPKSRQILGKKSGKDLAKFMQGCIGDLTFPPLLMYEAPILWIIDSHNKFVFALEEYIDIETLQTASIRPPSLPAKISSNRRDFYRLGHPSLTQDQKAKIGGELYLENNKWYLCKALSR